MYYKALLDASGGAVTEDAGTVRAAFFLAEQAQSRGDVGEVERLMLPFLDTGGRDRERAKALLRWARWMAAW